MAHRPVLFLPGAGGADHFWRPVSELLPERLAPVLVSWPGFGGAPPDPSIAGLDDLHRWLCARLPEGRFHLVAQSMGGVLAARLALEQPERVERLVLVATSGGLDVESLGAADWRPQYLRELPGVPRWFVDDRTDLGARLRGIRAPTLLLWSDADPVSPLAVGERLAREIPGARLEVVRGGDHAFAHERAAEVAEIIGRFLAESAWIRAATAQDEAGVLALWREVFPEYASPEHPHRDPAANVRRKLAHGDGLFWVAERDGRVVGTLMAGWDGHRGWLYALGVHPAARGAGVGRALVAVAERELRALGCPKVNLQVFASNAGARAFWRRLGYGEDPVVSLGRRLG